LWRGDHVAVTQLVEDFARYLYLPRIAGPEVLLQAIGDGLALLTWERETFAYSESFDEEASRYRGLRAGQQVFKLDGSAGLLVKPDVARKQINLEDANGAAQRTTRTSPADAISRKRRSGSNPCGSGRRPDRRRSDLPPGRAGGLECPCDVGDRSGSA
jgi:hypothetical protein